MFPLPISSIAAACADPKFLGIFISWYHYLGSSYAKDSVTGECGIVSFHLLSGNGYTSDVPLVLLAVVDDLIRLVGIIAVGFVIYGGIQYATSQGSPDATAKAQSTITNALIGLAISVIAVAFVSFIGNALT